MENKNKEKSTADDEPKNWEDAMGGNKNFALWKIIMIGVILILLSLKLLL